MINVQRPENSVPSSIDKRRLNVSSRLFRSILVGIAITVLLTCLELAIVLIFNPFSVPGRDIIFTFVAFFTHIPLLLLVPLIEFVGTSLIVYVTARSLAILAYLRDVQKAQEHYRKLCTSLNSLDSVYATPLTYYKHTPDPITSNRGQSITLLDLPMQLRDISLMLLGAPGAGKTLALQRLLWFFLQQRLLHRPNKIPIYIPLKNYSLFLKTHQPGKFTSGGTEDADEQIAVPNSSRPQGALLDFLAISDLPGVRHLRPYLKKLSDQGRLLLLCDGLDEVDARYQDVITTELAQLLLVTQNRLVISCCEGDYHEQHELVAAVNQGNIERVIFEPLQPEQVRACIERYIEDQGKQWQHTAGQIIRVIDDTRLRYICSNPMLLFILMEIIDTIGVERGKQLDTRGRLLQEYVAQLIEREQAHARWKRGAPSEDDVVQLLSNIACAARWSKDPTAIQLPGLAEHVHSEVLADKLLTWLDAHPAHGPFAPDQLHQPYDLAALTQILHFAQSAGLIDVSSHGVLTFRHALVADYFVAEYFSIYALDEQLSPSAISDELLANVGYWSNPVALWAGLLDTPIQLAEEFAQRVQSISVEPLALSLICIGVAWTPPRAGMQQRSLLPAQLTAVLIDFMHSADALEDLARSFTLFAGEGTLEIYHSLIPLLMLEGIEEFLLLLDVNIVLTMLFSYLCDTVDSVAYEAEVKHLCRILWNFGEAAVAHAAPLSQPAAGRSVRLRVAAINILGGTQDSSAVEPLIAGLSDTEKFILNRSINALLRLGPDLSLAPILHELENPTPELSIRQAHWAILAILERFLLPTTRGSRQSTSSAIIPLNTQQYKHTLETITLVFTSNYASEPETQQQARHLLVRLATAQESRFPIETTLAQDQNIQSAHAENSAAVKESRDGVPLVGTVSERQETLDLPEDQIIGGNTEPLEILAAESAETTGHLGATLAISLLTKYLSAGDEMMVYNVTQALQEIGHVATPHLLEYLHQYPPEILRVRIVEILKNIHDPRALSEILRMVADPSLLVQQQVTSALHSYSPASISGLIDLLLCDASEAVAERAAHILTGMGEEVVLPVSQTLSRIVPGRTRLLVHILEQVHDARAIPALITLLKSSQSDPLLTIAIIRALSQFPTKQVVLPLLDVLSNPQPQIYEEAIDALSSLGNIALDALIAALDVTHETAATPRIRRALLGMVPFPDEALLNAVLQSTDAQAQQIMTVLRTQGSESAYVLVQRLFEKDERLRGYVRRTLGEIAGPIVVPALLEVLNRPGWQEVIAEFLLKYTEAIPPLVNLLGDAERASAATAILPRFGPDVLPPLISALDDARGMVQEYAQNIIVSLVHQNLATLPHVIRLFTLSLPLRAHEVLLEVLTNELAAVSIPALLNGLQDAHLVDDVSEALSRLARKRDWQDNVLEGLVKSLRKKERRRGAETALSKLGALAVRRVGELITDQDQSVAKAAQNVLREIGVPALSFIWAAHGDTSNRARRDAAMSVFQSMPTDVIKDALVELLASDRPEDIAMAQALLLERIHDEVAMPQANQEMIPALLEYVQIHDRETASLRILALLFLLGGDIVVKHLVHLLYDYPDHHEQLAYAFLFLGEEAKIALVDILNDPHAPVKIRAEAMSMLGLLGPYKDVYEYAQSLSSYGLTPNRTGVLNSDQLAISLRALGSLLASGDWDILTLQNLRRITPEGSAQSELYHVLLGWRYEPEIIRLKNELQNEREARKIEIMNLTARIVHDQSHMHELEEELDQIRHEHGLRGDELYQTTQEKESIRRNLDQALQEHEGMRGTLDQTQREREVYRANLSQALQEKQALQAEIAKLETYNNLLQQQIKVLRGTS